MVAVAIVLLGGAVLTASSVCGVWSGIVGPGGILCVYATLLISDLMQVVSKQGRVVPSTEDLTTSPARALREKIHGIVMRAEAFEWQGEQVQILAAGVRRDPLFRELVTSGVWRSGGVKALAGQVARYLRARSRGAAVAAHLWDENSTSSALLGVDGERFRSVLARHGEVVRQGGAPSVESAAFEQFGFVKVLIRAARVPQVGGAVLWVGYPEQIAVTPLEERCMAELVEALADEMRYSSELAKLAATQPLPQKPAMLAQFSHDIRSPLSNVKAILSLLRLEELRSETAQLVEVALSNCRGVEAVVEDVIDLSRVQAGKMIRREEAVELAPLLEEVVEGFQVTARMRGLALSSNIPSQAVFAHGDKNQLRRIVTNLISNALKYTKFGSVELSLRCGNSQFAEISVADTGVGMSQEQVARLFEPFTRFQGAEIEGVGLGLSIVKMLIEQHHGSIEVQSTPGRGSVFTIKIPVGSEHRQLTDSPMRPGPVAQGRRILVVDDDADVVRSLARLLRHAGHEPLEAVTVHDALSVINFDPPDLVITDAAMPEGGGKRILKFIAEGRKGMPVVFLSGDVSKEQELKALGAMAVLEKPFDFGQLRALLAETQKGCSERALG